MAPRSTFWQTALINETVPNGGVDNRDLLQFLDDDERRGLTVVRCIGHLWMGSGSVADAWGTMQLDLGVGVIDNDAADAAAFPDPNQEQDQPSSGWLHRDRIVPFQNGVGTKIVTEVHWDARSMRKLGNGQLYLMMTAQLAIGTSFSVVVDGIVRVLLKRP